MTPTPTVSAELPQALQLAEWLEFAATNADMGRKPKASDHRRMAAAELRRLHAQVEALSAAQPEAMKDHQIAALVNDLRDIAIEYHDTQQLRERIAHALVPLAKATQALSAAQAGVPDAEILWQWYLAHRGTEIPHSRPIAVSLIGAALEAFGTAQAGVPADASEAHNFAVCQYFDHWLLSRGHYVTKHTEDADGAMAPALNWIASVKAMLAAPPQPSPSPAPLPDGSGNPSVYPDPPAKHHTHDGARYYNIHQLREFADRTHALRSAPQPSPAPAPAHVQNPPEIEHIADDVSKNGRELNMAGQPGQEGELPGSVVDAVAAALGDAYDCTRVWSAWSYGTMGSDDFRLVAEDGDRVAEIARAAIDADRAARAAPQPATDYDHGPQATTIEEAARDVGKWLNERPNRPIDLRHVAMLAHHAQAPQPATADSVFATPMEFKAHHGE